jgi:hypothetical protein
MKSQIELKKVLNETLETYKHNKNVLENVKTLMQNFGIFRGETQKIFTGKTLFEDMNKRILILITDSLHRSTNVHNLNPYGYFSDKEIKEAKAQEIVIETETSEFPITIHNAIKKAEDTFIAFVKAKDIVALYNSNLLGYNYRISNQYKMVQKNGKLIQTIDINTKDVKDIAQKILNNVYNMNTIILNVLVNSSFSTGKNEIEYSNDTLTINESTVEIISGLHDLSALAYILEDNKNIELKVELMVKHYNSEQMINFYNELNIKGGVN